MAKTPKDFYDEYHGRMGEDIDHTAGIQCVDGWKIFLRWCGFNDYNSMGYAPSGWAESIWTQPNAKVLANFKKITDKRQFKNGDWIIWAKDPSVFPNSHIAMYWEGRCFGLNQNSEIWNINYPASVMDSALGGFRWNSWVDGWHKKKYRSSGSFVKGQFCINKKWYFFDPKTEEYITGFFNIPPAYNKGVGKLVYYDKDGVMAHGQKYIDGYWYYFDINTGEMFKGIKLLTPKVNKEGYKVVIYDQDGRMIHGKRSLNIEVIANKQDGSIEETIYKGG